MKLFYDWVIVQEAFMQNNYNFSFGAVQYCINSKDKIKDGRKYSSIIIKMAIVMHPCLEKKAFIIKIILSRKNLNNIPNVNILKHVKYMYEK